MTRHDSVVKNCSDNFEMLSAFKQPKDYDMLDSLLEYLIVLYFWRYNLHDNESNIIYSWKDINKQTV